MRTAPLRLRFFAEIISGTVPPLPCGDGLYPRAILAFV
jgi:hypothetical protein